jgi:protein subunit release factor B
MSEKHLVLSVKLSDCRVDVFRSGGKGGQHQNTTDSGVRIVHEPSGAVGESREQRSQLQNKKAAFKRMANHPKMKLWINKQLCRDMDLNNGHAWKFEGGRWVTNSAPEFPKGSLKVEVYQQGRWLEVQ